MIKNKDQIKKFLISNLTKKNSRYKKFTNNTDLFKSGIDSLDYLTLIFEIEKKFKIKLNKTFYIKLNTLNKLKKEIILKLK